MKSIAIFLPNWIGDVVMATPAIRAVREHFPDARLISVSKPYVAEVVRGSPWFDGEVLFDRKGPKERRFWSAVQQLRQFGIDGAVLFPNSLRSALLARAGGARTVVGYARYFRDALLTRRLYPTRDTHGQPRPMPIIDDYNRIVRLLGVPDPGHRMELFTTPADEQAADAVWDRLGLYRFDRLVGLNPGGAFGSSKHWPTASFSDLARRLIQQPGTGVVVLCGPTETATARQIATQAGDSRVISLDEIPPSIGLSKAIVRRLSLLITTDSGPRHFAAAQDVAVLTLFGPTHIEWTETFYPKAVHLQKKLPCGPCQQRVCPLGHHRCMTELTAEEVAQQASRMLAWSVLPGKEHRDAG